MPTRVIETILETLAEWAGKTKDPDVLTEYARNALRRTICHQYAAPTEAGKLRLVCVTLDPGLEDEINGYVDRGPAGTTVSMPARVAGRITEAIGESLRQLTTGGHLPVVEQRIEDLAHRDRVSRLSGADPQGVRHGR